MNARAKAQVGCLCRQRGTAMIEFVLILPLLAIVLGLTFFFGWAVMHKHQVIVADRYSAWRRIETGAWPSEAQLNRDVFNNKAQSVSLGGAHPLSEAVDQLVSQTGSRSARAEELADELIRQRFPAGAMADVSASFSSNRALWDRFTGPIHHRSGREGITWRRDEVDCWNTLRDLYYHDLDDGLQNIPAPADGMAAMIRGLYLAHW